MHKNLSILGKWGVQEVGFNGKIHGT